MTTTSQLAITGTKASANNLEQPVRHYGESMQMTQANKAR